MKKEDYFARTIDSKEHEIKRLRKHILALESSEHRVTHELEQQLADKEEQIKKLIGLLNAREDINRDLSKQLDETIQTEQEYASKLKEAIRKKEASQQENIKTLARQLSEKDTVIGELHDKILQLEKGKVIKPFRDTTSKLLRQKLDEALEEQKKQASYAAKREAQLKSQVELLQEQLQDERNAVQSIEKKLLAQERDAARLMRLGSVETKHATLRTLRNEIAAKERMLTEVEKRHHEQELQQDAIIRQLQHDITDHQQHIKHLEKLVSDKDLIANRLERNFRQQLRTKQQEIEHLHAELKDESGRKMMMKERAELAKLSVQVKIKDETIQEMQDKINQLDEDHKAIKRRLAERQRLHLQSQETYDALIKSLRHAQEERIKELARKHMEQELLLRSEIDRIKGGVHTHQKVLVEKEHEIDDALEQFAQLTQKMMQLRGEKTVEHSYVTKHEREAHSLMDEASKKAEEALKKEMELQQREEELAKQQKAIEHELIMLRSTGADIKTIKQYMEEQKNKPREVIKVVEPRLQPAEERVEMHPDKKREALQILTKESESIEDHLHPSILQAKARAKKRDVFVEAQSSIGVLPKPETIRQKAQRITKKEAAFPSLKDYDEVDEILTIVRIGIDHGDTQEQIKHSLISTGYSKKNIDEAFKRLL